MSSPLIDTCTLVRPCHRVKGLFTSRIRAVTETTARRRTEDDPRYQRVRAKLTAAVLELAAERPADTITVSELTKAAGVSRAVFYSHAGSPADLLADVLFAELRPRLDGFAAELGEATADHAGLWRRLYLALLDHVQAHRGVYFRIAADSPGVLGRLSAYFEEAAARHVAAVAAHFPGGGPAGLWRALAVQQAAAGSVALITTWASTGFAESPEAVVDTYLSLAPPWQLAKPDADGVIRLRRHHGPAALSP
jgi:AcrR family transcriptional regulator